MFLRKESSVIQFYLYLLLKFLFLTVTFYTIFTQVDNCFSLTVSHELFMFIHVCAVLYNITTTYI